MRACPTWPTGLITIGVSIKLSASGHIGVEDTIAWVAAKGSLPIIGPELENNLAGGKVTLSPEQMARLDEVRAIPQAFPSCSMIRKLGRNCANDADTSTYAVKGPHRPVLTKGFVRNCQNIWATSCQGPSG